jgi:hypothetical protein
MTTNESFNPAGEIIRTNNFDNFFARVGDGIDSIVDLESLMIWLNALRNRPERFQNIGETESHSFSEVANFITTYLENEVPEQKINLTFLVGESLAQKVETIKIIEEINKAATLEDLENQLKNLNLRATDGSQFDTTSAFILFRQTQNPNVFTRNYGLRDKVISLTD